MNLNEGLNRRSFLKGAALMGGAAAFAGMAGCAPQTSASQELSSTSDSAWDKEVDVVIAGAGGGGLAAAVEASAAGKEVVVCEVMSSATMSNSALCAGMIQGACTKLQKEAGIDDSVEEFDKSLTAVAEGFESPELRRLYAEKSGETIDWLAEQGAALSTERLSTQGTMVDYYTDVTPAVARMHQNADGIGAGFTEPLRKKAEEQGAEFMFDTQVTRLLTNADGEVEGVIVADGGKEQRIKARLGVILNTGGFSRNADMVRSFMSPAMPGMFSDRPIMGSYGSPWQQGDGIMMACALGAKLVNPWCAYNVAPGLERKVEDNSAGYISMPGIFVSTDGQRHVLETGRPTETSWGMSGSSRTATCGTFGTRVLPMRPLSMADRFYIAAMGSRRRSLVATSSRPTPWRSWPLRSIWMRTRLRRPSLFSTTAQRVAPTRWVARERYR